MAQACVTSTETGPAEPVLRLQSQLRLVAPLLVLAIDLAGFVHFELIWAFGWVIPGDILMTMLIVTLFASLLTGWTGLIAGILAATLPVAASWAFFATFRRGPTMLDLLLLPDLLAMYRIPATAVAGAAFVVLAALATRLRWPRRAAWPVLGGSAGALIAIGAQGMVETPLPIRNFGAFGMEQFQSIGHWPALMLELGEYLAQRRDLARLSGEPPTDSFLDAPLPELTARSIHIVVMESFWRVDQLQGYRFSHPPFPPALQELLDHGGSSLSPVFGYMSSNAEFEILCGLPALGGPGAVPFKRLHVPEADCLPRKLDRAGWKTVAMVPSDGKIFNAQNAYGIIGFRQPRFESDFERDDMDGVFLSAASQFRQNLDAVRPLLAAGEKVFNYQFVNAGHWPYIRNEAARPTVIRVEPPDKMLEEYVNLQHHNAVALMDFITAVKRLDPGAIIVVLGDHLPLLDPDFATTAYRRSGMLVSNRPGAAEQLWMRKTPLLILKGGQPIAHQLLPQYMLPEAILDLASDGAFCRDRACPPGPGKAFRPFDSGNILIVDRNGAAAEQCAAKTAAAGCQEALRWLAGRQRLLLHLYDVQ